MESTAENQCRSWVHMIVLGVLVGVGALTTIALSPIAATGQGAVKFTIGEELFSDTYDPYTTRTSVTGKRICALVYEPLIRVPDSAAPPELVLADSAYSPAPAVLRVHLGSKLQWHDGRPITVDDVLYSYEVCKDPLYEQIMNPYCRAKANFVQSIRALQDNWIECVMQKDLPGDPETFLTLPIIPKHMFCRDGKFVPVEAKNVVGSGPVKLTKYPEGSTYYSFSVFQNWHGPAAKLEPWINVIVDDMARMNTLHTGGVSFCPEVPPRWLAQFANESQTYRVAPYASYSVECLALNFRNPLISGHKGLRKAMMCALRRQDMLDKFYAQEGSVVSGPFTAATGCISDKEDPYAFDAARALKLLQDEKFVRDANGLWTDKGKPIQFKLLVYASTNDQATRQVVMGIKNSLKDIGITIQEMVRNDERQWKKEVFETGDFDLALIQWEYEAGAGIGDLFHSRELKRPGGFNFIGYSNPEVDRWIEAFEGSTNRFERGAYCERLDRLLNDELPYLFLWSTKMTAVFYVQYQNFRRARIVPLTIYDTFGEWYAEDRN